MLAPQQTRSARGCGPESMGLFRAAEKLSSFEDERDQQSFQRTMDANVTELVTIGIKTSSMWLQRRALLHTLLRSIRRLYGGIRVIVADDRPTSVELEDPNAQTTTDKHGATWLTLPPASGLSYGRNKLVTAARTPFVLLIDDDVRFHEHSSIETLLAALLRDPSLAVAAGCYIDPLLRAFPTHSAMDDSVQCYASRFHVSEGGRSVISDPVDLAGGNCIETHMAHNFLLARTATLRLHGWDPRQKVGEHETFFYSLFLNSQRVVACPSVTVLHSGHDDFARRSRDYAGGSLRNKAHQFQQYFVRAPIDAPLARIPTLIDCVRRISCWCSARTFRRWRV